MLRLPGWLAFLIFFPLQVFLAIRMYGAYGFWAALGILVVIGLLATRAAQVHWAKALFFPSTAVRWEQRRHIYQGILFLAAGLAWFLVAVPQAWFAGGVHSWLVQGYPWLPLALVTSLAKATLR